MNIAYFIIYNKVIKILYDELYSKKVKNFMGFSYENTINKFPAREIILTKNNLTIKYNKVVKTFNSISSTDIYPIIYNAIYKLMNTNDNIMMHSSVVSNKNNEGLLILGDFGAGKTTLMKEFISSGWIANSTDQSLLKIENDHLWFICGSTYYGNEVRNIGYKNSISPVKINRILVIDAMTNNGDFIYNSVKDYKKKFRKIWPHMFWPWASPLLGEEALIQIDAEQLQYMCRICKKITDIFSGVNVVRGSKSTCVKKLSF